VGNRYEWIECILMPGQLNSGNLYFTPPYAMFRDAEKEGFQEKDEHSLSIVC
jgi:hypothetical protein